MSEIRQSTMSLSSMSFDTAASIGWPLKYQPLRVALANLLTDENLQNVRCSADQLITPLNSIAGAGTNDAVVMVTKQLIKNAFSNSGDDLFFSYKSLGWESMEQMICVGYNVSSSALVHRKIMLRGRGTFIFVPSRM